MTVLENYITLEPGKTEVLHFRDHAYRSFVMRDPLTKQEKTVKALVLTVDERGGVVADTLLSIIQEKLASQMDAYVKGQRYRHYTFAITRRGTGFTTEWEVQALPRGR